MSIETKARIAPPLGVDSPQDATTEPLASRTIRSGFARSFFQGEFRGDLLFPYPEPSLSEHLEGGKTVAAVKAFVKTLADPAASDRGTGIPRCVIDGLIERGVFGMTVPVEYGGRGLPNQDVFRIMEVLGARCVSTAAFVSGHHAPAVRALIAFGSDEQKARWLPALGRAEKFAGFAISEDRGAINPFNPQITAIPRGDGCGFTVDGTARAVGCGLIPDVWIVTARTINSCDGDAKITAFLVTPELSGFEVLRGRSETNAVVDLNFRDTFVSAADMLGPLGGGIEIGRQALSFGRTLSVASRSGLMKTCLASAVRHVVAGNRFGRPLAEFELVKKRLAFLAATSYAMEATAYETAALMDRGIEDLLLETAVLQLFAKESLGRALDETRQIHANDGRFTDDVCDRLPGEAQILGVDEAPADDLLTFIALEGMREVGERLKVTLDGFRRPGSFLSTLWTFTRQRMARSVKTPIAPVVTPMFRPAAEALARRTAVFARVVERTLMTHRQTIADRQLVLERIARATVALTTSACTLARIDAGIAARTAADDERAAAELYLRMAGRRFDDEIRSLWKNDDDGILDAGMAALRRLPD